MNRSLLSRIMPYLLAFYAVAFGAFFTYSAIRFPASALLPSLRWTWAFQRAFVLFMDYLIPIHAAAVAVAASRSFDARSGRPGAPPQPFSRIVSSAVVAFLVLTAVYVALAEGVAPRTRTRLADLQYASRVAFEYRREADAAMKQGAWREALRAIDGYLRLDPNNRDMKDQRLAVVSRAARSEAPVRPPAEAPVSDEAGAQALVEKARFYESKEDWFSAQYYAQAAAELDPRRLDAREIASHASNELARPSLRQQTAASAELFKRKKDALEMLESGDALGAYYAFRALAEQRPHDPDVDRFLADATRQVGRSAFFIDEARSVEMLPGPQDILFFNRNDAQFSEAVSIGKMVHQLSGDDWFFGIEAVRYDASGSVLWHFVAPYGRRDGNVILMNAVDRTDPSVRMPPRYLDGERPAPERNLLPLVPTVDELRALDSGRDTLGRMSVAELWNLRERLGAFGRARQTLGVELAMRLVMPFAFLVLSILCTALGWALRVRGGERLPAVGILLMPLLPVVLALASLLYLQAHRVLVGFTVLAFGLTAAFIALAVLQLVLLSVALVLLAGQSSR